MRYMVDPVVLVVGLGDLGVRLLTILAGEPSIGHLIGAGRSTTGREHVGQAALVAALLGGPRQVTFEHLDLWDQHQTAEVLQRLSPDVMVMAASLHTWWRPSGFAVPLPYGAWLPVHLVLVRRLMEAVIAGGATTPVISLPYPDAVGAALAPLGLAPTVGAGNVTEDAAKLRYLASREGGVDLEEVEVRLVMHHAAERIAFPLFSSLGSRAAGEPPWFAEIRIRGERLNDDDVDRLFRAPYPRPEGAASQTLTAAGAAHLVRAMLSGTPTATHAPAPGGRSGGFPVLMTGTTIDLRLPEGMSEETAVAINQSAARWDGIDRIEPDGTVIFTDDVARGAREALGIDLQRVAPAEQVETARAMLSARDRLAGG